MRTDRRSKPGWAAKGLGREALIQIKAICRPIPMVHQGNGPEAVQFLNFRETEYVGP